MKNILIVLAVSTIFYACGKNDSAKTPEESTQKIEEIRYPAVSVFEVEEKPFEHYFEVQGNIEADKNVMVVPEVGGLIRTLNVTEGQYIKKGHIIATFDAQLVSDNISQLEEQLSTAKYMYDKQKSLFDKGVGTEPAVKQAEGQYNTLLKSLETLKTQKSKFTLYAPFSGYVENVFPVIGQLAGPTTPIIQLLNLNKLTAKSDISEVYLKKIGKNTIIDLKFPALDIERKGLKIKRIGKIVNPMNRTVAVEVNIPNPDSRMIPNLMVVMQIYDYTNPKAITIPSGIILRNVEQKPFVYILNDDNTVSDKFIELGINFEGETEIISGLNIGDKVISKGARKIVSGDKVEVR